MNETYDIIVIGGGHAGAEASAAAATLGSNVLLITMDINKISQMSCNPAMGGIAKGQIVREIDALGGLSGYVTDETYIQFRMLNKSKGPAMWSPRAQSDKLLFSQTWKRKLENIPNLEFWHDTVVQFIIEKNTVKGVITAWGVKFYAKAVILTAGTFLNGLMHVGTSMLEGGRVGDAAVKGLSRQLSGYNIPVKRLKTGTPVRIDGRSIDFSELEEQRGDLVHGKFSFDPKSINNLPQKSCYIVHTNTNVHNELKKGFKFSPLFTGQIKGVGPRYCPSIEDKLVTFSSKDSHLLFLEPEGNNSIEFYLNGFSSSLPLNTQYEALRKIKGLEKAVIFRPGYAIEYDYFDPTFLHHTLESKVIKNLYLSGQVNGTTGYEEAASQGLIAGINAHQKNNSLKEFVLTRDSSYIGVLIDDLVTKGVDEPYRMFTSRAEYRILLRQDNADERLSPLGHDLGLLTERRHKIFSTKKNKIKELTEQLKKTSISPSEANKYLKEQNSSSLKQATKASKLLLRPEISIYDLKKLKIDVFTDYNDEILESVQISIKYENYIEREKAVAQKILNLEKIKIPSNVNYNKFSSISTEAKQKLNKIKPKNIGQASRIPGVSPSDVNVLLIFMGR